MLAAGLRRYGFCFFLAALVLALYGPSLNFGLIWDDPKWYQQGVGQSVGQLFTSLPSYQFYRPLAIWLNWQMVSPAGVVNAPLAHALQIAAHLISVLASVPALCALGIGTNHARLAALLFALNPFAYQAVAWQAPQQPLTVMWILLAVVTAHHYLRRRHLRWLILSLMAYGAALLFQESAMPFVFVFFWLATSLPSPSPDHDPRKNAGASTQRSGEGVKFWPFLHLALAAIYLLIWLNVPRAGNVTGAGFQPLVLGYLLQGIVFPVAALTVSLMRDAPLINLISLYVIATLLVMLGLWRQTTWRITLFTLFWIGAGLLPIYAGLSWDYVEVGSRLLYPASLGIALLWAGWMMPLVEVQRWWVRLGSGALLVGLLGLGLFQWSQFQQLYQRGTAHLKHTVEVLSATPDQQLLFINYPDRLEIYPAPYPLGVWGLTLAPVVQNLADYALAHHGQSASDESLSVFRVGAAERAAWPYRVFMRGSDTPPTDVYNNALQSDQVYVTDYLSGGDLRLRAVGAVRVIDSVGSPPLAAFGAVAQLAEARVQFDELGPLLQVTWVCQGPLREGDTIFVHLWQNGAFIGAADGDSLGGVLPLSVWQPGTQIIDQRPLHFAAVPPGTYEIRVGLYSQWDNVRYPALAPSGERFPDDEVPVGYVTFP